MSKREEKEMTYTKGKWKIVEGCTSFIIGDSTDEEITAVLYSLPNAKANAQLISASPALYEALKSVLGMGTIVDSYEKDKALEALAKVDNPSAL